MVRHGAVNETRFLEPASSGERFFLFAKLHPVLKDLREQRRNPRLLANVETVITKSKAGRERLKSVEQRLAARREQRKEGGVRTEPSPGTARASPGLVPSGSARRFRGRTDG